MGKYNKPLGNGPTNSQIKGNGLVSRQTQFERDITKALDDYPWGRTTQDLEDALGLKHQTLSPVLTNMEADGLVFARWERVKYGQRSYQHLYVLAKYRRRYKDPDYEIKPPEPEPPRKVLNQVRQLLMTILYEDVAEECVDIIDSWEGRKAMCQMRNRPNPKPPPPGVRIIRRRPRP